jgi:phosphoenolpyruvate phosphomutase
MSVNSASKFVSADNRRATLRNLLTEKHCLRFLEAHNPISAILAENASQTVEGQTREYDGFWSSSLTDSTARGKPDIEVLDIKDRLSNVNDIFEVTRKPLIMDGDTGGKPEHFAYDVRSLERLGVSAVIIEDKTGLKKNSLFGNDVFQQQESIEDFCNKIKIGKQAQISTDFMIIARIESLILDAGIEDALTRADAYIDAGADGVMIHSRKESPDEIFEFARRFRQQHPTTPLVCVPTSYSSISFEALEAEGFNVVIYANHMLRSAYMAMRTVADSILFSGRTLEVEPNCLSIKEILELIPGTK